MDKKIKGKSSIDEMRERLARRGVTRDSDLSAYPPAIVYADAVPFLGNVHIPAGRVAKRDVVDRRFRKLKF
jgi:hypothetical protein